MKFTQTAARHGIRVKAEVNKFYLDTNPIGQCGASANGLYSSKCNFFAVEKSENELHIEVDNPFFAQNNLKSAKRKTSFSFSP